MARRTRAHVTLLAQRTHRFSWAFNHMAIIRVLGRPVVCDQRRRRRRLACAVAAANLQETEDPNECTYTAHSDSNFASNDHYCTTEETRGRRALNAGAYGVCFGYLCVCKAPALRIVVRQRADAHINTYARLCGVGQTI